ARVLGLLGFDRRIRIGQQRRHLLERFQHLGRAPQDPDRLAAPLDGEQLARLDPADVDLDRGTGGAGARARQHALHERRGGEHAADHAQARRDGQQAPTARIDTLIAHGNSPGTRSGSVRLFYLFSLQFGRETAVGPALRVELTLTSGMRNGGIGSSKVLPESRESGRAAGAQGAPRATRRAGRTNPRPRPPPRRRAGAYGARRTVRPRTAEWSGRPA